MLKAIDGLDPDVAAFTAEGVVTADDYRDQLVPAVERIIESGRQPRVLYELGPNLERFDLGAMFSDARLGFSHLTDFARIAVVTDRDWIRDAVRAFGVLIPCPVQVFDVDELEDARAWIEERTVDLVEVSVEREGGVAHLRARLSGTIDQDGENRLAHLAREGIGDATELRVLIEAEDFHGWSDLRALWQHVRFVAGQRARLEKVAIVGDARWQRRAIASARHVLGVDARFFEPDQLSDAEAWIDA